MRYDLHNHTQESDAVVRHWLARLADARECYVRARDTLFQATRVRGLDGLAITNHDRIGDALRIHRDYPEEVIVGCEYTVGGGEGYCLHVVVLDVTGALHEELDRVRHWGLTPFVAAVRASGRPFFLAHVAWGVFHEHTMTPEVVDGWLSHFDAIEVLNSTRTRENELAARLARYYGLAGVGGSDGHELASIGRAYTEAPGATSQREFIEAFRAGRVRAGGEGGGVVHFRRTIEGIVSGFYLDQWDRLQSGGDALAALGASGPAGWLRAAGMALMAPHTLYLPHLGSVRQVEALEADVDRLELDYVRFLRGRAFDRALAPGDLTPQERGELLALELRRIHDAFAPADPGADAPETGAPA